MKKGNKVLSVIVTYNALRNDWIEKCLKSLIQSKKKTDIIVIDNASSDGTLEFIKENFPHVDLVESDINLGFGQANNIGLKKCLAESYDFAFLLNQDAWVDEDTIEKLINTSYENPQYGVLSPVHLNGLGELLDNNFFNSFPLIKARGLLSDALKGVYSKNIYEVSSVNAACWLVSVDCLHKIGLFDPLFFHYGEDINYCHRANYFNFKIGLVPNTFVYHDREERLSSESSNPQWRLDDIQVKIKYANPNYKSWEQDYAIFFNSKKKDIVKSLLRLSLKDLKESIQKYSTYKTLKGMIIECRTRVGVR